MFSFLVQHVYIYLYKWKGVGKFIHIIHYVKATRVRNRETTVTTSLCTLLPLILLYWLLSYRGGIFQKLATLLNDNYL
jgi:hypothetical protein